MNHWLTECSFSFSFSINLLLSLFWIVFIPLRFFFVLMLLYNFATLTCFVTAVTCWFWIERTGKRISLPHCWFLTFSSVFPEWFSVFSGDLHCWAIVRTIRSSNEASGIAFLLFLANCFLLQGRVWKMGRRHCCCSPSLLPTTISR